MRLIYIIRFCFTFVFLSVCVISCSSSFETDIENPIEEEHKEPINSPQVKELKIYSKDNPSQIIEDICCSIVKDSLIESWPHYIIEDKQFTAHIEWNGDSLFVNGNIVYGEVFACDFSRPVNIRVASKEQSKNYTVFIHSYTGLPVIWIETENRVPITSKEEYLTARFKLVEDVVTRSAGDIIEAKVNIKGRGNNTWELPPKKSYHLKFDEKVSLLNEPADKSWVLLANYYDKSLIRNAAVFSLGKMSRLNYTPRFHFVELFLNGKYEGTYQLTEKLKISKHRLDLGDDGFLIEADRYADVEEDSRYFKISSLTYPLNIKDPKVEYTDEKYDFVKSYFEKIDSVLYSDSFTDQQNGWQNYIDAESVVDWYLINEICKSCELLRFLGYFNLRKGDKLKFGPLWDYDKCFGNYAPYHDIEFPEGFWVKNCEWFSRLYEDPLFVSMVKQRFDFFYNHKDDILRAINENAEYLRYSSIENNNRWGILYAPNPYDQHDYDIWGAYYNEVAYLKKWILTRLDWLKKEFSSM